jgi:adenylate cyclase 3
MALTSLKIIFHVFLNFQQVANILLLLTAALIGLLCYILGEGKQRRAFVEAKQSLEVKTLIEEQSTEQVRER